MASLLSLRQFATAIRCTPSYTGHNTKGAPNRRSALCTASKSYFLLCPDVGHVFRKSIFLFFAECPGGLEMMVVDKRVYRVMHVTIIGALQIRDTHQIERDRLRLRRIRSAHHEMNSSKGKSDRTKLMARRRAAIS